MLGCGPKYTAKNGTVYKDGTPLPLYGVNWFGFETCDCAPHGLWSGRSIEDILSQLKALGFNAIRLPVGPEVLRNNCITPSWVKVGEPNYPEEPFDGLKYFLSKAKDEGFYVLLDLHTFKCDLINKKLPGMPFDPNRGYTKEDWLSDLRRMARLSLEFSNIFAIDLFNELLADDGRVCLNIPLDKNKGGIQSVYADVVCLAKKVGLKYQSTIVWNEQNISRRTAWGSWLSASAPYIIAPVEMVVLLYKEDWKRRDRGKTTISREEFIEWTNGMWTFPGENRKALGHPALFPLEVPLMCI